MNVDRFLSCATSGPAGKESNPSFETAKRVAGANPYGLCAVPIDETLPSLSEMTEHQALSLVPLPIERLGSSYAADATLLLDALSRSSGHGKDRDLVFIVADEPRAQPYRIALQGDSQANLDALSSALRAFGETVMIQCERPELLDRIIIQSELDKRSALVRACIEGRPLPK